MQAECGWMDLTGEPDGLPSRAGLSLVDYMSGVTLATGVLADTAAHLHFQDRLQEMCETLEAAPQAVIASVHGFALAGGMELALSCDIIVAAEDAELGDEHIRRNLLPGGGGSQRLPRKLGLARGMYYLLTGRRMRGTEAERIGLVSLAVPAAELVDATLKLADEMARTDGHALAAMKLMVPSRCASARTASSFRSRRAHRCLSSGRDRSCR